MNDFLENRNENMRSLQTVDQWPERFLFQRLEWLSLFCYLLSLQQIGGRGDILVQDLAISALRVKCRAEGFEERNSHEGLLGSSSEKLPT